MTSISRPIHEIRTHLERERKRIETQLAALELFEEASGMREIKPAIAKKPRRGPKHTPHIKSATDPTIKTLGMAINRVMDRRKGIAMSSTAVISGLKEIGVYNVKLQSVAAWLSKGYLNGQWDRVGKGVYMKGAKPLRVKDL